MSQIINPSNLPSNLNNSQENKHSLSPETNQNALDVSEHTCASSQSTEKFNNSLENLDLSDPDITQDFSEFVDDEDPVNFYDGGDPRRRFLSFEGISPVPKLNKFKVPVTTPVKAKFGRGKVVKSESVKVKSVKSKSLKSSSLKSSSLKSSSLKLNSLKSKSKSLKSKHANPNPTKFNPATFYGNPNKKLKPDQHYNRELYKSELDLNKQIDAENSWYNPVPLADIYTPSDSIDRIDTDHVENVISQKSLVESTPTVKTKTQTKSQTNSKTKSQTKQQPILPPTLKPTFDSILLDSLTYLEKASKQKLETAVKNKADKEWPDLANFKEDFKRTLLKLVDRGDIERLSGKGMTGSFKVASK